MSVMKQMLGNSYLFGANAPFIEELYESYLENPASVTDVWRDYFDGFAAVMVGLSAASRWPVALTATARSACPMAAARSGSVVPSSGTVTS